MTTRTRDKLHHFQVKERVPKSKSRRKSSFGVDWKPNGRQGRGKTWRKETPSKDLQLETVGCAEVKCRKFYEEGAITVKKKERLRYRERWKNGEIAKSFRPGRAGNFRTGGRRF